MDDEDITEPTEPSVETFTNCASKNALYIIPLITLYHILYRLCHLYN